MSSANLPCAEQFARGECTIVSTIAHLSPRGTDSLRSGFEAKLRRAEAQHQSRSPSKALNARYGKKSHSQGSRSPSKQARRAGTGHVAQSAMVADDVLAWKEEQHRKAVATRAGKAAASLEGGGYASASAAAAAVMSAQAGIGGSKQEQKGTNMKMPVRSTADQSSLPPISPTRFPPISPSRSPGHPPAVIGGPQTIGGGSSANLDMRTLRMEDGDEDDEDEKFEEFDDLPQLDDNDASGGANETGPHVLPLSFNLSFPAAMGEFGKRGSTIDHARDLRLGPCK